MVAPFCFWNRTIKLSQGVSNRLCTRPGFVFGEGALSRHWLAWNFLDLTHEDYRQANWALITDLVEGKRRQFQIEKKSIAARRLHN
jgi:hypothetical protein